MKPALFLGPMSKNVVQAVIDSQLPIALIPSRRQVELTGGYIGYSTEELYNVTRGSKVLLCRDHAGPQQGAYPDDGLDSLKEDSRYLDIIHIDPWKVATSIQEGIEMTAKLINYCLQINPSQKFEVGTEQAIYEYSPEDLDSILSGLEELLAYDFSSIEYACVQSGTGLDLPGRKNTRTFDSNKLSSFIEVCKKYEVKSKEHNGDYLVDNFGIATRFKLGLDAINIAPELGQLETEYYLYKIGNNKKLLDKFYNICYESRKWEKWVDREVSNYELILTAGHYVLNTPAFIKEIKSNFPEADKEIQQQLQELIKKMYIQAHGLTT